jgi:hypothetical protein
MSDFSLRVGQGFLRGLILLVGLIVPGGCGAGPQSVSGSLLSPSQRPARRLYNRRNYACG